MSVALRRCSGVLKTDDTLWVKVFDNWARAYRSFLNNHILPKWGATFIQDGSPPRSRSDNSSRPTGVPIIRGDPAIRQR